MSKSFGRVGVLAGGLSEEAAVSRSSAAGVLTALREAGVDAVLVNLDDRRPWRALEAARIDIAFPVTHGVYGEDGCLQGVLEWMGTPYVGSGVLASALAMNKVVANRALAQAGCEVPLGCLISADDLDPLGRIDAVLGARPVCMKPNEGGSSVGIERLHDPDEREAALQRIFSVAREVLVEELIIGIEVTVGTLDSTALGSTEVAPKDGFYDFSNKYTAGATVYHSPARLPAHRIEALNAQAALAIRTLGCRGGCRVDFLCSDERDLMLEVNTLPGLTPTSLLPMCAEQSGLDYTALCLAMLRGAQLDRRIREAPEVG
jgi:D-alanine-D-alanine ligase